MKWFEHHTAASANPKLVKLRARYGAAGYGLYWYLVEKVGERFEDYGGMLHHDFDPELIAAELRIDEALVEEMLAWMVDRDLFQRDGGGELWCEAIKDHLSEHLARKYRKGEPMPEPPKPDSGATPEPHRSDSGATPAKRTEQDRTEQDRTGGETPLPPAGPTSPAIAADQLDHALAARHYAGNPDRCYRRRNRQPVPETVAVLEAWQAHPDTTKLDEAGQRQCQCLILTREAVEHHAEIIERAVAGEFTRGWGFEQVFRPKNYGDLLAGNYRDGARASPKSRQERLEDDNRRAADAYIASLETGS